MQYYSFLARPKPETAAAQEYGGAYVNCWINRDDPDVAESEARAYIEDGDWSIQAKEEDFVVRTDDDMEDGGIPFKDGDEHYYREAQEHGACYVFHTWPVGTDEDDV